ncbi:MAG: hypothetical protein ACYDAQ_19090 [Mycobacteriales bacterium]
MFPRPPGTRRPRRQPPFGSAAVLLTVSLVTVLLVTVLLAAAAVGVLFAAPALAAAAPPAPPSLPGVIDSLRTWLVGLLAGVATLFLTIGGLRYITAGGDPMQVERAKSALKSAAIGYALAALAPLLVTILASVVTG